ncbi:hypothetical protein HPP92_014707 [Vanilla planifolia]|uniref:DNA topoisomerase 2 n=1 Tax=Vanilla planifolia TaxID=51239 RepID=A0A835QGI5_VANPL|nr:hypothetical protein HPP92_014707 [Vanilla planifolia]
MANAVKKLPLQTSTAHNSVASGGGGGVGKKTIEEMYQKKTQLEHILLRPDTYIGSVEKHTQNLWVFENGEMVNRPVTYVPGLYKIFDEILVNAADNKQRDPSMDSLKVEIDAEGNSISVYNNGDGVPIEIHQEEGVYVPELIFGHLLTSSNYDDNVKKTTGGRNGYGAKLTNIFFYRVHHPDGRWEETEEVFTGNMGKKTEPSITKGKDGENWTKVTFKPDLAKFNMAHLEEDVVALMKKRVVDLAGTLGKTVKVELNGQRVPVKSFADYVNLYLQSASKSRPDPLPRIAEKVNDRWEICVSLSDGQFQQVSFVNSINTIKGGTHVEYVTSQIASHVMSIVNKKNKNANLKPHNVRNHLWVFVNALIDNPAFDSQTKETLTTRQGSFGSKCDLSQDFLKKVAKSGIVENLLSWADFKQSKEMKKTDGTKRQKISGISKLDDANDAGGKNSDKCTLILTEGDSAKALAMAGIAVVGRNNYGVFPLRGKLLNVREASHKQIMENAEIQNIKQILGLQHGKQYDSVKGLRYGHLMIMTDQDHDGSHIKGLLINFIPPFGLPCLKSPRSWWSLLHQLLKNGRLLSFYTIPEYEAWKESLGGNASGWSIKYYKGLGTSTSKEGKEYFQDLQKHKKDFFWTDEQDGEAIELAFSKKKIEARKNWLRQFEPGTFLDQTEKLISYSDFVNKELILFSMADLQRSIASMVAQFSGYVSEHSAYHHGEQSLASTIIGMAQDFVGSNNINLLQPNGQFGTRHQGGKDHASVRYVYTRLSPMTRFLFPKDDDLILDYLKEDGQSIEPTWYVPIIPMVLVNGSEGIGTGWSSYIPNYNPRDIVANVKRLLNDEPMQPMDPWYRGFKGRIEKTAVKEAGATYTVTGIIDEVDSTTVKITELPIRRWTQDYKEFLESLMNGTEKVKEPFIKDYREYNDDTTVHFEVALSEENMNMAKQEGLEKNLSSQQPLVQVICTYLTPKGVIKILEEFFLLRVTYYDKRKKALLDNLESDLLKLDNKVRFILGVVRGEIIVNNRKRADLFLELQAKGFTPFPKKPKGIDAAVVGAIADAEEAEETNEVYKGGVKSSDYEYLLSMAIGTLTWEKVQELCIEKEKLEKDVEELRNTSPKALWMKDLDALENELQVSWFECFWVHLLFLCVNTTLMRGPILNQIGIGLRKDAEAEVARKKMKAKAGNGGAAAAKSKKPRKKTQVQTRILNIIAEAVQEAVKPKPEAIQEAVMPKPEAIQEAAMPKGKGRQKKPTPEAVPVDSDEDAEVVALKDRLAAYNLDSSPDNSDAKATKKVNKKRGAVAKKANTVMLSEDDTDDEDFGMAEEPKGKKGGGKRANKTKATASTKPGAGQSKQVLSQKLISEMFQPQENAENSPEKKVRRIRPSPFNKKSASFLNRAGTSGDSSSGTSVDVEQMDSVAKVARPKRENRTRAVYVESDQESEEDDSLSEYSNVEEDDE